MNRIVDRFIDYARGTCLSTDEVLSSLDIDRELEDDELDFIEGAIFRCTGCSWWVDIHEIINEEGECNECCEER